MIPRRATRWWVGIFAALALLVALSASLFAQTQNLPPAPDRYMADEANVLDPSTQGRIENQLRQFEKDTSNQIVVAIYPNLPDGADIDQYTIDTFNAWKIGQKDKDNGVLLMVFVNDHKMFICTGRGLEGALPDAICKNIVTQVIGPRFKQGDYGGGVQAGVNAIIAATKGEYKGTGTTDADSKGQGIPWVAIIIFIIIFLIMSRYGSNFSSGPIIYSSGGYGGGGYSGGGGGGGFSGGGGSSAGGGAGGSW